MAKLSRVKLLNDGTWNENGVFGNNRTFPVVVWADVSFSGGLATVPNDQLIAIGANADVIEGMDGLSWFIGSEAEIL